MKEPCMAIFGPEKEYIFRFGSYLQKKLPRPFKVRCFTEEAAFRGFLEDAQPELCIVPEALARELEGREGVFFFSETARPEDPGALYRYRPMEKQLRQLLQGRESMAVRAPKERIRTRIWGVYSPVHGCGQSVTALLLGQLLAEEAGTLYLNTERFSGLAAALGREKQGSLSELLYYARVRGHVAEKLPELTEHSGNLSLLFDAGREDLDSLGQEDWRYLLESVRDAGLYRHLVLDLGDGVRDERWLLELCDRIYMPVRRDRGSGYKETAWRDAMEAAGQEELLNRIRRFTLPEGRDYTDFHQLRFTEWGRFVKQLLREEDL